MSVYFCEKGDIGDSIGWNFPEDNIPVYIIGKYPYKAKNKKNAEILHYFRQKIDLLCDNILYNLKKIEKNTSNKEYIEGVYIFLGLHKENKYDPYYLPSPFHEIALKGLTTSRYLLSEIPEGTIYSGLNKPKLRYIDERLPFVGNDGQERALYRDIFLDLNKSEKSLEKLIIHELAHSMANHVEYRPDDHHKDFKWAENLIKEHWPN